jgi:hypothetical protein
MKVTRSVLKSLIKEEIQGINEADATEAHPLFFRQLSEELQADRFEWTAQNIGLTGKGVSVRWPAENPQNDAGMEHALTGITMIYPAEGDDQTNVMYTGREVVVDATYAGSSDGAMAMIQTYIQNSRPGVWTAMKNTSKGVDMLMAGTAVQTVDGWIAATPAQQMSDVGNE